MNSISFRHKVIIKTAVAKQRFVQDLIQKYGEGIIKPDFGLISRYWEQKGLKGIDTLGQEYRELIDGLPSDWTEAKRLIESEFLSAPKDPVREQLLSLGLQESDIVNRDVRAWLEDRYIKNIGSEVHPLGDTLQTIKEYSVIKDALIKKISVDDELRKELENKGFSEERLADPIKLSADDMVFIIGQYKHGGKTTIRTVGVEIKPEEYLGKVGEWNIWLPQTQETSAKIAGYDEITKDPKTDWCTNRTKGSNLFYHYISRGDIISFLFYIIKDNPSNENDWLSIGFTGSEGEGMGSVKPVFDGQNGGMTVNKNNIGLVESDFKKILGKKYKEIFDIIKKKIKELNGKNPATEALKPYTRDISLFKKEYWNKSEEEREDFSDIILQLNPENKDIKDMAMASARPLEFLSIFSSHDGKADKSNLHIAATNCAKKDSIEFLKLYSDKDWAVSYRNLAAETLTLNEESGFEFLNHLDEMGDMSWAREYIERACDTASQNNSFAFLENFRNLEIAKPYVEKSVKKIISGNSENDLLSLVEMTVDDFKNGGILSKYKDDLFKKLAASCPKWFLGVAIKNSYPERFRYNSNSWSGSRDVLKYPESKNLFRELAKEYISIAVDHFTEYDPINYLHDYPEALPYLMNVIRDRINNDPLFIFNFSRITYPIFRAFLSKIPLDEKEKIIAGGIRSMGPIDFIIDYAEMFDGDEESMIGEKSYADLATDILSKSPEESVALLKRLDRYRNNKSYFKAMLKVANDLVKKDPAYFIQNLQECKFCIEPLSELGGRSFMDIANDITKVSNHKIMSLYKVLMKIGRTKEASYIIGLC